MRIISFQSSLACPDLTSILWRYRLKFDPTFSRSSLLLHWNWWFWTADPRVDKSVAIGLTAKLEAKAVQYKLTWIAATVPISSESKCLLKCIKIPYPHTYQQKFYCKEWHLEVAIFKWISTVIENTQTYWCTYQMKAPKLKFSLILAVNRPHCKCLAPRRLLSSVPVYLLAVWWIVRGGSRI